MYIAVDQGQTTPKVQTFDVNRNRLSLRSFATSLKSDFIHLFHDLYMYKAQGQTAPWGQNIDVNRNFLSLRSFITSFKKSLWNLILYTILKDFIHVYSPRAGQTTHWMTQF